MLYKSAAEILEQWNGIFDYHCEAYRITWDRICQVNSTELVKYDMHAVEYIHGMMHE